MNAFPTIMSQVFKQAGLPSPFLDEYVTRHEEVFEEFCTGTLTRSVLKKLFLVSLHGGNYFHHVQLHVPFLDCFQRELKSCTRKLLDKGTYTYLKQITGEKGNLGSAIAMMSQADERFSQSVRARSQQTCLMAI